MKRKPQQLDIERKKQAEPEFVWVTPYGEEVPIDGATVSALDMIQRIFPGAHAAWWRTPGRGWQRNG